ncbi:MAG: hypothetical protein HYX75_00540 [Acidobacteria bacterium]|nr:hypothetical protein [Acidobacteriota bacterium]
MDRARTQHAAYVGTLAELGVDVHQLPSDEACPDCCFVEDTAVVIGAIAVLTCPGAVSRRAEVEGVASSLRRWCTIYPMHLPATLDGGDVLRAGDNLFVGLSGRTNDEGAAFLEKAAATEGVVTTTVKVRGGLHLKSSCSLVAPATMVYLDSAIDPAPFRDAGLRCIPVSEQYGANALLVGDAVLVSSAAPRTAEMLAGAEGIDVRLVDVTELHKADGALTCLSIRIPGPGCWCA